MKIYIGADHAGFRLKQRLIAYLRHRGYSVIDKGARTFKPTDDYPDYAFAVGKAVAKTKAVGVLVCGSSQGVCIAANKVKGVRAVAVQTLRDAKLSKEHNDANVLCLSGWKLTPLKAQHILDTWLATTFSKAERHVRRLGKICRYERQH